VGGQDGAANAAAGLMPTAPPKACVHHGCKATAIERSFYCQAHQTQDSRANLVRKRSVKGANKRHADNCLIRTDGYVCTCGAGSHVPIDTLKFASVPDSENRKPGTRR
jgi:hypothetical protein